MKKILVIVSMAISLSAFSQIGTFRGFVYDKADESPIPYANVVLKDKSLGTSSNLDGYFQINNIPVGEYDVEISFLGYTTIDAKINVKNGKIVTQKYYMVSSSEVLDDVVLSGKRQEMKTKVLTGFVNLGTKDIQRFSVGGDADLVKAIQILPGVVTTGDQGGQIYIRGGAPIQNLTLLDGMIVYNPFHSIGFFSVFDTDILQSADIYTAGFNAQYGSRNSSVMDVRTRPGNRQRLAGKISASTYMGKALLEGPIGKKNKQGFANASFLVSAKSSYLHKSSEIFYPYVETVFDGLPFKFTDIYGKLSTNSAGGSNFNAFGFSFSDEVRFDENKAIDWGSYGAGFDFKVIPAGSPTIIAGNFAFSDYQINSTEYPGQPRNSNINGFNGGLSFTYFVRDNDEVKYGFEFIGYTTEFEITNSIGLVNSDKNNTSEIAGYAKYRWVSDRLVIEPGFRVHYYASLSEMSLEPRLSLKWNTTERLRLKASAGIYSQNLLAASSDRDVVNLFYGFLSGGNSRLPSQFRGEDVETKLQRATHVVAGFEYDVNEFIDFNFETYYKKFHQIINTNRNKIYPDIPAYSTEPELLRLDYIIEEGDAYGFDVLVKAVKGQWNFWGVYSWSRVLRDDGVQEYHPHFDRRHNVNLVLSYKWGKDRSWELSTRWNYGSGFPFTPTQAYYPGISFTDEFGNPVTDADYTTENGEPSVLYGDLNSNRLTDYHRLDIDVKKIWKLSGFQVLEATLGATNLYNRENIFYFNRVTATPVNQLPIMPYLAMSYSF